MRHFYLLPLAMSETESDLLGDMTTEIVDAP